MNGSIIRYVLGYVIKLEAAFMLLPALVGLVYQEKEGVYYLIIGLIGIVIGVCATLHKPENNVFYLKEGCVTTAASWMIMSLYGCLPFWISREIPFFVDALFETISGFTTTGASILGNVEALSHCSIFWRSFTHWIGGMGVLVFLLAIIPLSGGSNINLMRAESPGPSVGKLVPKVKYTAQILYLIYIGMTIILFIFLVAGDMPIFDALNTSFGTAGTGGFAIRNDSMMGYSPYLQWVVTIFMILFGVNFNAYYFILLRKFRKALAIEEVRGYFLIIFTATVIISINIYHLFGNVFETVTHAAFQVGSIITTTGFASTNFDLWPQTSRLILVILMFIGACAGSTGGGIKVSRFIILIKTIVKELTAYIHPKNIKKIKMEDKPVEHEVVRATNVYFVTFMILFSASVFAISFEGKDLVTTFTAVAATINNVGPGLAAVGPVENFGHFSAFSKFILMFDMLAGRLELFPMLIFFHPTLWKDQFAQRKRDKRKWQISERSEKIE